MTKWSEDDYSKFLIRRAKVAKEIAEEKEKKQHKFNAQKTIVDGTVYDSKRESKFAVALKNNNINFVEKKKIVLQEKFKYNGESVREIAIIPDFTIMDSPNGRTVAIVDTKGMITPDFKIKFKMLKKKLHDMNFEIPLFLPANKKECENTIIELLSIIKSKKQ